MKLTKEKSVEAEAAPAVDVTSGGTRARFKSLPDRVTDDHDSRKIGGHRLIGRPQSCAEYGRGNTEKKKSW